MTDEVHAVSPPDDPLAAHGSQGDDPGEVSDTTPTTSEEAMDNVASEDGLVEESAYAPTDG